MTGLQALKLEMLERGCTRAQTEAKAVAVVLDIIANTGDKYTSEWQDEEEIKKLKSYIAFYNNKLSSEQQEIKSERQQIEKWREEVEERKQEVIRYQQEFNNALRNMETDEARDLLRTVQLFIELVNVKTAYDNTAYIYGLAAIMSRGAVKMPDEMKKVSSELPDTRRIYTI